MKKNYLACCILLATSGLTLVNAQKKNSADSLKQKNIDEVVITAYGIKKEKKSLGYVYQDIKGSSLVDARENNVTNSLVGKVSGLQVVKSAAGPAASSKIILRGFNSLTNDNQPLIVVDGVPMVNFVGAANNDFWNPSMDFGNGLSDLNPEDIESVTVLKGGAASALYGSRAGNGVILITTKTGKGKKGIGITLSETVGFSELGIAPEIQKIYGQGSNGVFPTFTGTSSGESWGPKIEGQEVIDWNGKPTKLRFYDNLNGFFQMGQTNTHTITIQNTFGKGTSLYTSASYMTDEGIIPEAKYKRLNLTARAISKFGNNDRWSSDVKIQFINSKANNRPVGGQSNASNYYGTILRMPTTMDITQFKKGMERGAKPFWWVPDSGNNPYWFLYNNINEDIRNRFLMNAQLKYAFNDWLDADVRVGTDMYNTKTERRSYYGGPLTPIPTNYHTGLDSHYENNYIVSINAHKKEIIGKWDASISIFGQIMKEKMNSLSYGGPLIVPNYFSVSNIKEGSIPSEGISEKQINSLFSTAEVNYDGFWFLNGTIRWDWSSTLVEENRRYFYPSVSSSLVVTDMMRKLWNKDFGRAITFAKLRASYAVTGNSLAPYSLYNNYQINKAANQSIIAGRYSKIKFNPYLEAELIKTFEAGINLRFFNRVDLDVNYYNTHATKQLIALPMNPMSGFNAEMVNAGDIQNRGLEIAVNTDLVKYRDFKWNMLINYSRNINKILELKEGIDNYKIGGFDTLLFNAIAGGYYGTIFGSSYQRVEEQDSPFFGKKILNESGLPTVGKIKVLGDQTSRGLLGITNSFTYKNVGLSFQLDGRFGGQFYSGTRRVLNQVGLGTETVINGKRDSFVVDGVISDGNGGYVVNTKEVTPQQYWGHVSGAGNLGINEEFIHDATNIRLRNIQLTYSLPKAFLKGTMIQSAKASFSVNNVWLLYSSVKGIDPESVYATGTNAVGFENMSMPTLRTYLFNITLSF